MNNEKATICKFCGTQISNTDVFCVSCGKAINLSEYEMSKKEKKFYQKGWFSGLMLFLFSPAGIALLWVFHRKHKVLNSVLSVFFGLFFLIFAAALLTPTDTFEELANDETEQTIQTSAQTQKEDNQSLMPASTSETTPVDTATSASEPALVFTPNPTHEPKDEVIENDSQGDNSLGTEPLEELLSEPNDSNVEFIDLSKEIKQIDVAKILNSDSFYVHTKRTLFSGTYLEVIKYAGNFIYYGGVKNNKPHGKGMLYELKYEGLFPKLIIGNFKEGKLNGFATIYIVYNSFDEDFEIKNNLMYKFYEGYFKNDEFHGKGNFVGSAPIWDFADEELGFDTILNRYNYKVTIEGMCINSDTPFCSAISNVSYDGLTHDYYFYDTSSLFSRWNAYVGEFKNDKFNGKGKEYLAGILVFDGKFKNGKSQ